MSDFHVLLCEKGAGAVGMVRQRGAERRHFMVPPPCRAFGKAGNSPAVLQPGTLGTFLAPTAPALPCITRLQLHPPLPRSRNTNS